MYSHIVYNDGTMYYTCRFGDIVITGVIISQLSRLPPPSRGSEMHLIGGGTLNRLDRNKGGCCGCGCCCDRSWVCDPPSLVESAFGWSSTNPLIKCRSVAGCSLARGGGGGNLKCLGLMGGGPTLRRIGIKGVVFGDRVAGNTCKHFKRFQL